MARRAGPMVRVRALYRLYASRCVAHPTKQGVCQSGTNLVYVRLCGRNDASASKHGAVFVSNLYDAWAGRGRRCRDL
ncbi:hypothetical protein PSAC2689_210021 [Paraburkholderia sacchari]